MQVQVGVDPVKTSVFPVFSHITAEAQPNVQFAAVVFLRAGKYAALVNLRWLHNVCAKFSDSFLIRL